MTPEERDDMLDAFHAMCVRQQRESLRHHIGILQEMLPLIADTDPQFLPEAAGILRGLQESYANAEL